MEAIVISSDSGEDDVATGSDVNQSNSENDNEGNC